MANPAKVRTVDGQWVDLAVQVPDLNSYAYLPTTPVSGFRNKIINGGFDIWQRGTSFAHQVYNADRWIDISDVNSTISKQSFTLGAAPVSGYEGTYYLRHTRTSGGTYSINEQRIEDVRTFAGQTVTLSYWARVSSGTIINDPTIIQAFGSGGSAAVTASSTAVTVTTSWQRFSHTFNIPSISGKTIGAGSSLTARVYRYVGSSAVTFDIWGVQLEAGSVATPFEQRPIQTEIWLCQRYFQRLPNTQGVCTSNSTVLVTHYLTQPMAKTPVISSTGSLNAQADGFGTNSTQSSFTKSGEFNTPESIYVTIGNFSGLTQGRPITVGVIANNSHCLTADAEL